MSNLRCLLLILSFLGYVNSFAQTTVEGYVWDHSSQEGIPGVTLSVKCADSTEIKAFAITDTKGYYKIHFPFLMDSLMIEASCLGYETQCLKMVSTILRYDFSLKEKLFQLKEVKIKANKITQREDTITYVAPAFTSIKDRSLEDILKKMPGITVRSDGSIQYDGKSINRFYIEDMNLLDGQYTLASRNLSPDKVASVQVLENHQPIKALENTEFSDRAALNIKLKKNGRSQWLGNGDIALGFSPFLWQARAFSVHIAPQQQGLFSYKGNNTGVDILSELNALPLEEFVSGLYMPLASSLFSSPFISSPALSAKRSFFNSSHLLTLNQLWKYRPDTDVRLNIDFMHEEQQQESRQRTEYFQADANSVFFSEQDRVESKLNGLRGKFTFIKNKKTYYLENKVTANARWQEVQSSILTSNTVSQKEKLPQYSLTNQFHLVRSLDRIKLRVISMNQYESLPQKLNVNVPEKDKTGLYGFEQEAGQKIGSSHTAFQLERSRGAWKFSTRLEYNLKWNRIRTNLNGHHTYPENDNNVYSRWDHQIGIIPGIVWTKNKWDIEIKIPVKWQKIKDKSDGEAGWYCNPSGIVRYKLNSYWNLNVRGSYARQYESLSSLASDRMTNYRTFYRFNGHLPFSRTFSADALLSYRNVISAFFSNVHYSYRQVRKDNIQERIIKENYIITDVVKHPYHTESHSLSGEISKLLEWKELNLKLGIQGSKDNFSIMQNNVVQPYTMWSANIEPQINLNIFHHNTLSYKLQYTYNKQQIPGEKSSHYTVLKQDFSLFWVLLPRLNLTITGEYFYNRFDGGNHVKIFLADMELRCTLIKHLEISALWSNIFDKCYYSYSYFTNLSEANYAYKIRPSELLISLNYKF